MTCNTVKGNANFYEVMAFSEQYTLKITGMLRQFRTTYLLGEICLQRLAIYVLYIMYVLSLPT